jgi:hypothetical protein
VKTNINKKASFRGFIFLTFRPRRVSRQRTLRTLMHLRQYIAKT